MPRAAPFRFVTPTDPPAGLASVSAWAMQSLRASNSHALQLPRASRSLCARATVPYNCSATTLTLTQDPQSKNTTRQRGVMHLYTHASTQNKGSGLVVALLKSSTSGSTTLAVVRATWQRWCRGAPQRRRLGLALPPLPCFGRSRPGAVLTDCKSAGLQQRINSITTRLNVGWLGGPSL